MKKQIKYFLIVLLLFVLAGTGIVNAATFQATDENIAETDSEELIYVIGTHLFTEETPYISTQIMMYAARTIDIPTGVEGQDALEYMKVYSRDLEGNWIEAISGETVDLSGVEFDIQYKDLEKYVVTTANVKNVTELEEALANPDITTINLIAGDKFETDHSILVSKPVTINGNGETITFTGESGEWRKDTENYVVKVYNTEATISDITLTGANAALLVNSSDVVLEETINVDGNAFGGIEVSKGVGEGLENPSLDITNATLEHEEVLENPTIWEDGVNDCIVGGNLVKVTGVKVGQVFYFNEMPEANVTSVAELEHALQTNLEVINLLKGDNYKYETDHVIVVGRDVTINGNGNIISYVGEEGSWSGGSGDNYVLQVYNTEATIKDLGFTGASAGLLVNASKVTLGGTINVSGNVFGGIEVSKGVAEGLENSQLTVNGTIVMDNEERTVPIIWIEKDQGTVTGSGIEEYYATTETNNKEQTYYYSDEKYATTGIIESSDELLEALTNEDIDTVELTKDVVIETEEETLTLDKKITINGNGATIKSKLNITGNEVKIQDVKLNNTVTVTGENVVLDEVEMTGFDTGYSNSKPSGVSLIKVNSDGPFTLTNSTISKVTGTAYNLINIATPEKIVIENNTFGTGTDDLTGIYNLIEFSQAQNKAVKDGTIIRNNVFNSKAGNNVISMFNIEDGATITIENNTFAYSGNALRLSNYFNTSATFNIYDNTVLDGSNDGWGGFICFQAVGSKAPAHADTYFAKYTINVKNLVGTDGNVINTVEGTGTGANRVGYYYADYTVGNIMPDSAKATVNFVEE